MKKVFDFSGSGKLLRAILADHMALDALIGEAPYKKFCCVVMMEDETEDDLCDFGNPDEINYKDMSIPVEPEFSYAEHNAALDGRNEPETTGPAHPNGLGCPGAIFGTPPDGWVEVHGETETASTIGLMNTPKDRDRLPFDLEKALAGWPLVTRRGETALNFVRRSVDGMGKYNCAARINGEYRTYTDDGQHVISALDGLDLFLCADYKPDTEEEKEGWINHYGTTIPVPSKMIVEVKLRSGEILSADAARFRWDGQDHPSDIVFYRVSK